MIKHSVSLKKNSLTWEEYIDNYSKYLNLDYLKCLNKLARIFGKENIIVKRFDKEYFYKSSLFADFLKIFDIELTDGFIIDEELKNKNTRVSENACEIKRVINELDEIDTDEMRKYEWILRNISDLSERDYPRSRMSGEERDEFMKLYELSNQKLADKYIGDGKPLFHGIKSAKEKWQQDNLYLIRDLIRFTCILDVYNSRDLKEQKEEICKLKSNTLCSKLKTVVTFPFRKLRNC